MTEMEVLL